MKKYSFLIYYSPCVVILLFDAYTQIESIMLSIFIQRDVDFFIVSDIAHTNVSTKYRIKF